MEEDKLKIGIGNIEPERLEAKEVTIQKVEVKMMQNKEGKDIGEKVICYCSHPDSDEPIEISSVKYERDNKIRISGLWFQLDKEGLIQKGSALALFLSFVGAGNLEDLENKKVKTSTDENGYLIFKGY